jgi:2,3-bisphosphoglycerate-dependent phosphoglycerate mutase
MLPSFLLVFMLSFHFFLFSNWWFHTLVLVETALILIRHGESLWNEKNLFTGSVDVPLTKRGIDEAILAGKRISNIPIDMIFTSVLIRAQMTAMLAMAQHRRKRVFLIS